MESFFSNWFCTQYVWLTCTFQNVIAITREMRACKQWSVFHIARPGFLDRLDRHNSAIMRPRPWLYAERNEKENRNIPRYISALFQLALEQKRKKEHEQKIQTNQNQKILFSHNDFPKIAIGCTHLNPYLIFEWLVMPFNEEMFRFNPNLVQSQGQLVCVMRLRLSK